MVRTLRAMND